MSPSDEVELGANLRHGYTMTQNLIHVWIRGIAMMACSTVRITVWLSGFLVVASFACRGMAQDLPPRLPRLAAPVTATTPMAEQPEKVPAPMVKKDSLEAILKADPELRKELETVIETIVKRRDAEKKNADEAKKKADEEQKNAEAIMKQQDAITPSGHHDFHMNLPILFDSMHPFPDPLKKSSKWYDKFSIRGYTQIRFDRTLNTDEGSAEPNVFGDRGINGRAENFFIRRLRFIFSGELNEHLFFYIQPDFGSTVQGVTGSTNFGQMRDAYADIYVDKEQVHRFRVGLSKVPYGWENLQSSINRIPLDRTDAMNTGVAPNERDLGIIYYWTPVDKQKLLKALVDSGLKGSGNYGIFGIGVYDGQGGSVPEANLNLHAVARLTWPVQLDWSNGQVIEASIQGYRGEYVVTGGPIRALGRGPAITPLGTGGTAGILEERVAATFVFYPQPFGLQAEWQVGKGPGLNDAQTDVISRPISGGYVMGMYRWDTHRFGIVMPYCRWQQFSGGYRNVVNAPYGHQRQLDLGVEWQIFQQLELTLEYSMVNTPNFTANSAANARSFNDFEGSMFRVQLQFNY